MKNCAQDPHKLMHETLEILGGKWKMLILWHLSQATRLRFGELKKRLPEVSQRILTLQLRNLEKEHLVKRKVFAEVPLRVEYQITKKALALEEVFLAIVSWRKKYPK